MPFGMNSGFPRHVITEVSLRMCIPLDESRELFQGERAPFGWSKGVGEWEKEYTLCLVVTAT
jgi:hypothetical protein